MKKHYSHSTTWHLRYGCCQQNDDGRENKEEVKCAAHVWQISSSSSSSRACPYWSLAVSTRYCQRPRSWAYLHAEFRPRLCGWRSDSSVRSQVRRGCPGRRLQSLGNPWMDDLSALLMSSEVSVLARCPKKRSRLVRISWDNCGGEPTLRRTVALLTWSVYRMQNIRRRQILSKASTRSLQADNWSR